MLIEEKGLRILTDPGNFTTQQDNVKNIDVVLITHEHQDHLHVESLKTVMKNNPSASIITNKAVAKLLDKEKLRYTIIDDGKSITIKNVLIEGYGKTHVTIYKTIPPVENTGYFISHKLFYPGDAFYDPKIPVEILAVPVAGPWMKISEAIDYLLAIKPKKAFPVHDGMIVPGARSLFGRVSERILKNTGIQWIQIEENKETEF